MTAASFQTAFPEFGQDNPAVITRWITAADEEFDAWWWGGYLDRGMGNWIAHQVVMEKARNVAGAQAMAGDVTTKTMESPAGRVSVSRGNVEAQMKNPFMRTIYGQEYFRLAGLVGMGVLSV